MSLTLEQYATYLDTRDRPWPAPPAVHKAPAKPHLVALPGLRAVTWNIYGTLLSISGGELVFEHPQKFVMDVALDKTLQEFKMWGSMTRKPGQPAEYLGRLYARALSDQRMAPSPGEKYPEIAAERIWEDIVKKLLQKEYQFDTGFFGSLNEYSRKVAYFFHGSMQGTACYPGAAEALAFVRGRGLLQGLIADAQCFTLVQLQRGLAKQQAGSKALPCSADDLFDGNLRALSCEQGARKPSERLFRKVLDELDRRNIAPHQVLHIGARIIQDLARARKLGMRTALFAGDKESLQASAEQLKDPATRPDMLLTGLGQITKILA